jgi:acetoin utilization deacetylase AcuC-like enzyme
MSLTLIWSPRFADHVTPPGHPERRERAETMGLVATHWREAGGNVIEPHAARDEDLTRVHDAAYVASLAAVRGRAAMLDVDTFTSPDSDDVARLAAGAVIVGADLVLDGPAGTRALALVRPPGHHAEADRAMGFCLFNSVAVGAAWARARGSARVAIVDYDVHHGNGTQATFYDDPSVLFISSHQFPFYPGTGAVREAGSGAGTGATLNLPLEVGATDADYDLVYRDAVLPALEAYGPDLLLISAGFDAHERDPLAGMRLTAAGFGRLTARLVDAADRLCGGRVVFATEGGYDLPALRECLETVVGIASGRTSVDLSQRVTGDTRRGQATLEALHRMSHPLVHRSSGPASL